MAPCVCNLLFLIYKFPIIFIYLCIIQDSQYGSYNICRLFSKCRIQTKLWRVYRCFTDIKHILYSVVWGILIILFFTVYLCTIVHIFQVFNICVFNKLKSYRWIYTRVMIMNNDDDNTIINFYIYIIFYALLRCRLK